LKSWRGAYIVISHDRQFLKNISNKTWWIDRGVMHENAKGFEDFEEWSQAIWDEEEKQKAVLDTKLRQEARWMLRGVTARRKRNQGRLRKVLDMREQRRQMAMNTRKNMDAASFQNKSASQLVAHIHCVNKTFGERHIVKDFSFRLMKGDRIGIVGPNGIGKSTLIKLMIGKLVPDSGEVKLNDSLEVVYLDQMQESLDLQKTVADNVCESGGDHVVVGETSRHIVAYLKDFLFYESQIKGMTHILSGGERNRLALAKAMTKPCDLLVLDEPTNDLDTDTLDLLTELLTDFKGTLLIISHDRDFLDQTVTSLIAFNDKGCAKEYIGGYQDYLRQLKYEKDEQEAKTKPVTQSVKGDSISDELMQEGEPKTKNRLSYKQKRSHEMLPQEIDTLTVKIAAHENILQDLTLYQTDAERFLKLTVELENMKKLKYDK
jgi:ATP-binding cassette subfamily F protein uup